MGRVALSRWKRARGQTARDQQIGFGTGDRQSKEDPMPDEDRSKALVFRLWAEGKSLAEIQTILCKPGGIQPENVKGWVTDWERGNQKAWNPKLDTRK